MNNICILLTITIVVGPEDDEGVLEKRDENDGVDDEGEGAEDIIAVLDSVGKCAFIDVQGRCSDVTVHHPDALECQTQRPAPTLLLNYNKLIIRSS